MEQNRGLDDIGPLISIFTFLGDKRSKVNQMALEIVYTLSQSLSRSATEKYFFEISKNISLGGIYKESNTIHTNIIDPQAVDIRNFR